MARVAALGCIICGAPATIHHCGTHLGGGRNHMKVLPLCVGHHIFGPEAIDGKQMSKGQWQDKYGSETKLLRQVEGMLGELP